MGLAAPASPAAGAGGLVPVSLGTLSQLLQQSRLQLPLSGDGGPQGQQAVASVAQAIQQASGALGAVGYVAYHTHVAMSMQLCCQAHEERGSSTPRPPQQASFLDLKAAPWGLRLKRLPQGSLRLFPGPPSLSRYFFPGMAGAHAYPGCGCVLVF